MLEDFMIKSQQDMRGMNDQKTESKLQVQDIQTFVEQRISIIGDKLQ